MSENSFHRFWDEVRRFFSRNGTIHVLNSAQDNVFAETDTSGCVSIPNNTNFAAVHEGCITGLCYCGFRNSHTPSEEFYISNAVRLGDNSGGRWDGSVSSTSWENTDLRDCSLGVSHTALEMFINHRQMSSVQGLNDGVSSSSSEFLESLEFEIENVSATSVEQASQEQVVDLPKSKKFGFRKVATTMVRKLRGSKKNQTGVSSTVGKQAPLLLDDPIEEPVVKHVDGADEKCDEVEKENDKQE